MVRAKQGPRLLTTAERVIIERNLIMDSRREIEKRLTRTEIPLPMREQKQMHLVAVTGRTEDQATETFVWSIKRLMVIGGKMDHRDMMAALEETMVRERKEENMNKEMSAR